MSQLIERLTARGTGDRSSVSIKRDRGGEHTLEVTVRTGDSSDVTTIDEAERKARQVFDRLAETYTTHGGGEVGSVKFVRNAKGETQIEVEAKTDPLNLPTLRITLDKAGELYASARARFPLSGGTVGASAPDEREAA